MSKKPKEKKRKIGKLARREAMVGYTFVLPWIIGASAFMIWPLIKSFYFALSDIRVTPKGLSITYIGLTNFTQIPLEDLSWPTNLMNYFIQTLLSVPIIVVFSLIIAIFLNQKIKCKGLFRLIFFLPVIIVSGPVMTMLVSQDATSIPAMNVSVIESTLKQYLSDPIAESIFSVFSNMIQILWYSGVQILIFLSALQKIDSSLYEAAKMDGGSGWECFWKITLPTIKPMILLNAVYTVIYISNNNQNVMIESIKAAMFAGNKGYGYASAMAWEYSGVVTALVVGIALLLMTRRDAYDKAIKKHKKELRKQARLLRRVRRRGTK